MRFLRRGSEPSTDAFWSWWAGARDGLDAAIRSDGLEAAAGADITRAVQGIDKRLPWEVGPGASAEHAFCLSPAGDPEVRVIALRWLASAPSPDETWEYHASKQAAGPDRLVTLRLGDGSELALADMRAIASWDERLHLLDVRLWHPEFPAIPDDLRLEASFVFLDNLLGEDEVERWIGVIETLDAPTGGLTPAELCAALSRNIAEAPTDSWVMAEGEGRDGFFSLIADASLKRIDLPFHESHLAVTIRLDGFPDRATAAHLDADEDVLIDLLASTSRQAGRRTDQRRRVIHFVTAEPDVARSTTETWRRSLRDRQIDIDVERDPRWAFMAELGR